MKKYELEIMRQEFPDKTDEELIEFLEEAAIQNQANFEPIQLPKLGTRGRFDLFLADFKAKLGL